MFLVTQFSLTCCYLLSLVSKHDSQIPFSDTLYIRSSLRMTGQISHSQKTAGTMAVPCILILDYNVKFMSLDRRRDTRCCSWLRQCATSRKIATSIPNAVIGIFLWLNPSGRTMALGSTQPPTKMSTMDSSWRKRRPAECLEIVGASTSWSLSKPVMGKLPFHTQIEDRKIKYLEYFNL
jgi:hypothetical protein